jgi:hypothetical protein
VFLFAQSVYLIFAAVYVCKETVEHLLLSAGEGHHHHSGDEEVNLTGYELTLFAVLFPHETISSELLSQLGQSSLPSFPSLEPL